MKKSLLLAAFIITMNAAFSQNLIKNAGINVAHMNIDYFAQTYTTSSHAIITPIALFQYEHQFNRSISVKPGIGMSRQGKRIVMDLGAGFYNETKFTINYIDFPLLLTYNFSQNMTGGYNFNINAGPYLSYGFNGLVSSDNSAFVSEEKLFAGTPDVERGDFGLLLMAGFGLPDHQMSLYLCTGLKNLAITGGDYTKFSRFSLGMTYTRVIDFGPNARRMLKKRFF